jgi:hypothetical protein
VTNHPIFLDHQLFTKIHQLSTVNMGSHEEETEVHHAAKKPSHVMGPISPLVGPFASFFGSMDMS